MAAQHETELYQPLKYYFEQQGYEVKSEVNHCDLVGIHPDQNEPLIVEIKKTFNLALLLQGIERQKLSSQVYLAVERNRAKKGAHNQRWSEITLLCQRLGLGLITITLYKTKSAFVETLSTPYPSQHMQPQLPRKSKPKAQRLVSEFKNRSGDYNVGGSTGRKLYTAYREKALRIAIALRQAGHEGPMSPREAKERTGIANAALMMQDNYYGWFQRISRGRYSLTPAAYAALDEYDQLLKSQVEPVDSKLAQAEKME